MIWNQLNSHEISSFLLPCFYCSRIMYISIVSSDISDTMDINVIEISSSQGTGPPLFSPTWRLRHLLSLWTLHDALPPFQFSPCKSQKVGSCWGHQSQFQQRYFKFEFWPKVTHLKKKTIYRGYQLSPHFFLDKDEEGSLVFFGCFFCQVCLDLRRFCLNPRFVQCVAFCNDHMSRHVEHDVSKMCWTNRNLLRYVSFVLFCFCCFFGMIVLWCWLFVGVAAKPRWTQCYQMGLRIDQTDRLVRWSDM